MWSKQRQHKKELVSLINERVDEVLASYEGENAVLIGEIHINPAYKLLEEKIAESIQPDIILHEGFPYQTPQTPANVPETLRQLNKRLEIQINTSKVFRAGKTRYMQCSREMGAEVLGIPFSSQDLSEMPFYRMNNNFLMQIKNTYINIDQEFENVVDNRLSRMYDSIGGSINRLSSISSGAVAAACDFPERIKTAFLSLRVIVGESHTSSETSIRKYRSLLREVEMARQIDKYSSNKYTILSITGMNHVKSVSKHTDTEVHLIQEKLPKVSDRMINVSSYG